VADALYATLHTNHGPIRLELFPNHAPKTVENFVGLANGTKAYTDPRTGQPGSGPYYDGTTSHRVISGFMVQLGDPTATGRGGPGYTFADEIHPELSFDRPYLLAMANAGPGPGNRARTARSSSSRSARPRTSTASTRSSARSPTRLRPRSSTRSRTPRPRLATARSTTS
jgi:cyclophilin family peptidyl-prolyl cis-trans isomerase